MEVIKKKVVVVGSGFCGKTSLLLRFSMNQFPENSSVTTFTNTYVTNIEVQGKQVELTLVDTPGEKFGRFVWQYGRILNEIGLYRNLKSDITENIKCLSIFFYKLGFPSLLTPYLYNIS